MQRDQTSSNMRNGQRALRVYLVAAVALLWGIILASQTGPLLAAPLTQAGDPVLVGAGSIADCTTPNANANATANLLDGIAGTIFTLGDHAYANGALDTFNDCYDPTWGRHRARTQPVPGAIDYLTPGAAGYYEYFGAAASPHESNCTSDCQGYYSYNLGAWHIVALNSELTGTVALAQLNWLRDDLAANPNPCTLAYWHRPLFTSGLSQTDAEIPSLKPYWETLYHYGADVILNGRDQHYERFAPQKPNGQADPTRGIRQFVVGTGGAPLRALATIQPNSEVRNAATHGVLKLTLHPTSYDWQFVPVAGQSFSDSGTANCVTAGPTIPAPVGYWRMDFTIESHVFNSVTGNADGLLVGNAALAQNTNDNNVGWISSETAKNVNSVILDGTNDFITVNANSAYSLANEVTLAAWVNLVNPMPDQKIVGKLWLNFPNGSGYLLGVRNGQLQAEVYAANDQFFLARGGTIAANIWTHVAMTWRSGGQFTAYINGLPVTTTVASLLPIGNRCESGKGGCNVVIGGAPWFPSALGLNGNVDEVLIFNQALSADAIAQLAQRTFIVNNTGDSDFPCNGNNCSLRAAITGADARPNGALRDRIHFALPDPTTIQPTTQLPAITEAVVMDGLSQPGASCSTWPPTIKVALDGTLALPTGNNQAVFGLFITTKDVLVRGLNVRNFSSTAILLEFSADGLIECNLIGTDLTGTTAAPNGTGISVFDSSRDQIVRNLIAGNEGEGMAWDNGTALLVQGNYIGTNINGTVALANFSGIEVSDSSNNRIGGATEQARNLISGNENGGITLLRRAENNTVQGNIIGADGSGQGALGNGGYGIRVIESNNNTIGGKNAGNLIAYNVGEGVWIDDGGVGSTGAIGNFIAENRIYRNTALGIDLGSVRLTPDDQRGDGVTANDAGDGDGGANNLQNYPVLTGAASNGSSTTISGTLNSLANTEFLLEFYSNDNNAACQGTTLLGFAFVTTAASGNINFSTTLSKSVPTGQQIAATASAMTTFDTSEFSACIPVSVTMPVTRPVVSLRPFLLTVNEGAGNATLTVNLSATASVPITVLYSTSFTPFPGPEDATPASDYTAATNQSLVIAAGQLSATLQIPLVNDTVVEQNERFGVTLALPPNSSATLDSDNSTTVVTIVDNDGANSNNTAPVANAQTVNLLVGTVQSIILFGTDSDSDPLTYSIVTQPANGTLSGTPPNLTYTPNPSFTGADSFTFKVNDGKADSAPVTVTLRVTETTPPVGNQVYLPLIERQVTLLN